MHVIPDQHYTAAGCLLKTKIIDHKAVANGPVAWSGFFAGPLFLKVKTKFHFTKKQVINKSTRVIFGLV